MKLAQAIDAFVRSVNAIERALENDDLVALATAIETRGDSLAALKASVRHPKDRDQLAGLGDRDRVLQQQARERLECVRGELNQLRKARRVLRRSQAQAAPRFVSRRA